MYFAMKNRLIMLLVFSAICGLTALIAPDLLAHEEAPQIVKLVAVVSVTGWLFSRKFKLSESP